MLPHERGRGVGQALLDSASERLHALGAGEISLDLLVGNDDAGRFYEREGFRPFAMWLTKRLPEDGNRGDW